MNHDIQYDYESSYLTQDGIYRDQISQEQEMGLDSELLDATKVVEEDINDRERSSDSEEESENEKNEEAGENEENEEAEPNEDAAAEEDEEDEEEEEEDDEDDDDQEDESQNAFANVGQGLTGQYKQMMIQYWQEVINSIERQDHDFKNHQLPLARIKKVMKTDEGVRMISAEAPILFAKGCDIFITELTMRAWIHAEENKRKTLQKSDISAALQKSDMFDFLIDVVPRDTTEKPKRSIGLGTTSGSMTGDALNGHEYNGFYNEESLANIDTSRFVDPQYSEDTKRDLNSTQSKYNSFLQQLQSNNVSSSNTLNSLTTSALNNNRVKEQPEESSEYINQQFYRQGQTRPEADYGLDEYNFG